MSRHSTRLEGPNLLARGVLGTRPRLLARGLGALSSVRGGVRGYDRMQMPPP